MTLVLAPERLVTFWPEAKPLLLAHSLEVGAIDCEADFSFDLAQARALDAAGAALIMTARENGALVGYCIWYLCRHMLTTQSVALQSGWYVIPAKPSTLGLQLFRRSLGELRERGVREAYPHFYPSSPPGIAEFFTRLGAEPNESVYRIKL